VARNVRILLFDLNPADYWSAILEKKLRISCKWLRLTIVQNDFLAETAGNDLPKNLLTLQGEIVISEVGRKRTISSRSISSLLTPFSVGAIERCVSIFRSCKAALFDQVFAAALTLSLAMSYSLDVTVITKSALKLS
jgi:hypothetical protein